MQASQSLREPRKQLNNHTAGHQGWGQNSQAQAMHVNQLRTHVLTVPQQHRPAISNTCNAHVSDITGADCSQIFSMNSNASTHSVMQRRKPGGHSSMPGHMHQGNSGYSHASHAGHHMGRHMDCHMDSHMGSLPKTLHIQKTSFSSGHDGYRGKLHPANHMTHFTHGLTDGTSSSGASSSGDGSGDGASSSGDGGGDGSGVLGRQAPAFQVHVLHGDQELKVHQDKHLFDKSKASLHSLAMIRKEKTTPFGVNVMRSPVLHRAAQGLHSLPDSPMYYLTSHAIDADRCNLFLAFAAQLWHTINGSTTSV